MFVTGNTHLKLHGPSRIAISRSDKYEHQYRGHIDLLGGLVTQSIWTTRNQRTNTEIGTPSSHATM
jgi:hypothetical protein